MSGFDVHPDEMPAFPPLDDAALEAWLAGRNGAADDIEPLALFAEDLGTAMSGPAPSPKSNLAQLLAEGFSPDPRPATTQAAPPEPRSRKKMLIPGFLTGLAAKLALGVGVAAAGVGGAGAAGVLPGPVQDVVLTAVSAITPFDLPSDDTTKDVKDAKDAVDDIVDDIGDDLGDDEGDDTGSDTGTDTGVDTNPKNDFGKAVSADARGESDGVKGVDGQAVSEVARNKNNDKANGGRATGQNGAKGLDRANQTPGGGKPPASDPAGNGNAGKGAGKPAPGGRP